MNNKKLIILCAISILIMLATLFYIKHYAESMMNDDIGEYLELINGGYKNDAE